MKSVAMFLALTVFYSCMKESCVFGRGANSFYVHKAGLAKREVSANEPTQAKPKITNLLIESNVSVRFGKVNVRSEVLNEENSPKETNFIMEVPLSAFISRFTMTLGATVYVGQVLEKEEAKKLYEKAKENNETAGHVEQQHVPRNPQRGMETFTISVNIEANSEAIFELQYEELINRRLGFYRQNISIQPNQIVPNLTVVCNYYEPQGLVFDKFMDIRTPSSSNAITSTTDPSLNVRPLDSGKRMRITYRPSAETQSSIDPEKGLKGMLSIRYDVRREGNGGITVYGARYTATFVSSDVPESAVLLKNFVFVIDISGSMGGDKIRQAREALVAIIGQLRLGDVFNIVLFDDKVEMFQPGFVSASFENKENAYSYIEKNVDARGGTNINSGLLAGITLFQETVDRGNIMVFLTDGEPTAGETNKDQIRENIRKANHKQGKIQATIFALAFGRGVQFEFLNTLSIENGGSGQLIYEEGDAASQIEEFYQNIEDAYLKDGTVQCNDEAGDLLIGDVSQTSKTLYFATSEFVVVGLYPTLNVPECYITGVSAEGRVTYTTTSLNSSAISVNPVFIERLYAYKRIKDLLDKADISLIETEANMFQEKALNLSLHYQFVTPLTSLVVTQDMKDNTKPQQDDMYESAVGMKTGIHKTDVMYSKPVGKSTIVSCYTSLVFISIVLSLVLKGMNV